MEHDLDTGVTEVAFTGRLGLSDIPLVRATLFRCFAECPLAVVVDLNAIVVPRRVALMVFPAAHRYPRQGPAVALMLHAAPTNPTGRVLRRQIGSQLPIYDTREQVLAAAQDDRATVRRVQVRLAAHPVSPGVARGLVAGACHLWRLAHLADTAQLVVSELVSNAVQHAGTDIDVTAMLRGAYLHLSVRDRSTTPPRVQPGEAAGGSVPATGGRGLHVVRAFTAGWGATVAANGKSVWALLRTNTSRPVDAELTAGEG